MPENNQEMLEKVIPLMYRARWPKVMITGVVIHERERMDGFREYESAEIFVAPGDGYRAEILDQEGDRSLLTSDGRDGKVPYPELLIPASLLSRWSIQFIGSTEYLGRRVYSSRLVANCCSELNREGAHYNILVDAEIGIILRCEKVGPRLQSELTRFINIHVDGLEDEAALRQPELTDEQVNLLYRTGLPPLQFAGDLRERIDLETVTRLAREALVSTKFGRRSRRLWEPELERVPLAVDLSARLAVAMPGCYRLDGIRDPRGGPISISCDGTMLRRAYVDRVEVRPAKPAHAGLRRMMDPSWLLDGYELSATYSNTEDQRALRITAVGRAEIQRTALTRDLISFDSFEGVIDVDLGLVVQQVLSLGERPVVHDELANIESEVDLDMFRVEPLVDTASRNRTSGTKLTTADALALAKGASKMAWELGRRWVRK